MFNGETMRTTAGPSLEETRDEVKGRAEKLLGAYEKNVAPLLEGRGLQHGVPDPEGHIHYAQQMLRVLKTIQDPRIDPYHWPENFERPDHIPLVFKNKDGEIVVREIEARDFDNPKKLVDKAEEILMVGQIEGL